MPKTGSASITRSSVKNRAYFILLLAIFCVAIAYPQATNVVIDKVNGVVGLHIPHVNAPFVLGLDLQGGTRLEYEADVSKVASADQKGAMEGVRDVIERRVNSIGVSEPLITTAQVGNTWRLQAELAGIRDVNQAIKLIGETPILEFKEQNDQPSRTMTADEKKKLQDANVAEKKTAEQALAEAKKDPSKFEELVKKYSTDESTKALNGDIGFLKDLVIQNHYDYVYLESYVSSTPAGAVYPALIEGPLGYDVVKVEEAKADGQEVMANHVLVQFTGATGASTTLSKVDAKNMIDGFKARLNAKTFNEEGAKITKETGGTVKFEELGWFKQGDMIKEFETAVYNLKKGEVSAVVESPFGYHIIYRIDERPYINRHIRLLTVKSTKERDILPPQDEWKATQLTGKQVQRAMLDFDQRSGRVQVSLQFNDEGTKLFADLTKKNLGKPVAIFLDGKPISTPNVQSVIPNGQAVITGQFTVPEAQLLAQRLQAGALPVPIKLIAQQTVGPTLGQDSVQKSLTAGLFGFLFIVLFMLAWYRLPGLVSIVALVLYVALSLTVFKLLPVTLTLSGIAGFILSLGIAVDANVLIYERLKEEVRSGRTYASALEEAFKRAWTSIRDGNTTTLIACAVLYWFSSSVIKGFALTLAIGILLSLFTSIIVTRTLLRLIAMTSLPEKWSRLFLNHRS